MRPSPATRAATCVIVSYWTGRSKRNLLSLLHQMYRIDAGAPFDVVVVCNGGDVQPLELPKAFLDRGVVVLNRRNSGYNIGAWDHGWKHAPGFDYYLFLQDECFIKAPAWVAEFEFRMREDQGIGLLGESLMWDQMSWSYIRTATDRDLGQGWYPENMRHPIEVYRSYLEERGLGEDPIGTHLQSLILFTSDAVLRAIGGLPSGDQYHDAVSCEIFTSRVVTHHGWRLSKIRDHAFALIGHRQWTRAERIRMNLRGLLSRLARASGIRALLKRQPPS